VRAIVTPRHGGLDVLEDHDDWPAPIESGRLRPFLAASFPLERFRDAQETFMAKRHVGNIVIDLAGGA
jgi:NADPH:quinone reductase-like Zn-dependent oxidoreductase